MPPQLDHLILQVNDVEKSIAFYTSVLGFRYEGRSEPFCTLRVTPELILQLAPWGTQGGTHLAFALPRAEFDAVFERVRDQGIEFGDQFHSVGSMQGPGDEPGARGPGKAVYMFDPDRHLIEIRYYESPGATG